MFVYYIEINMEENVKIILLGQDKTISKESISNLQPLINEDNFKLIRLPPCMGTFKPKMKVLHSCLYYTLAVQKELEQSKSFKFRQKCLSDLSEYYILQKMNFQLYEYSFLCSRILSIPLDKAMHVVYFLVYARLASKPFIKNIIVEMEMKNRLLRKKTTMRSEKQYSIQSKSQDSRHLTIFCDINATQTENLRKQLKKIANPQITQSKKMTKRLQNRRYFNIRKLYPNDSEFKEDVQSEKIAQYHSTATSRIATIPNKVCYRENSSVITRLKFNSGIGSEDNLFKKVHVRRQKFNEKFESSQKYLKLLNQKNSKQNKKPDSTEQKITIQKDSKGNFPPYYRSQKNAFEYFQGIATNIRNKNEQFDAIRFSCVNHHKERNLFSCKQSSGFCNYDRQSILSKHTLKTQSGIIETHPQNYLKMETNRDITKKESKKQQYTNAQTQKQNQVGKMFKTTSEGKFAQMILQDYILGNITRKNDSVVVDDDQIVLFNRKLKNKFKLQKYKHQYQQFLKSQLFQKAKANI